MCLLYGWTREYVVDCLSCEEINIFYQEGTERDLWRRGWNIDIKDDFIEEDFKQLRDMYYSDEELAEIEKHKNGNK